MGKRYLNMFQTLNKVQKKKKKVKLAPYHIVPLLKLSKVSH